MTSRSVAAYVRERTQRERLAREAERQLVLTRVVAVVREILVPESVHGAWVVGSLAVSHAYDRASDVDIAVLGLPPDRYLSVLGTLQERLGREDVDLIELERVPFRSELERRGHRVL